jgi:hypothetical protein
MKGLAKGLKAYIMLTQFAHFTNQLETDLLGRGAPWTVISPQTNFSLSFQFVWYEIVESSDYELGRNSGNLYRDLNERKLQELSCLVGSSHEGKSWWYS